MTQHIPHHAGIDISKDHLDAHVIPADQARRFANTKSGWRALASRTLPIVRANPRRARSFANAIGTIAKTDPVDARMLAQYAGR